MTNDERVPLELLGTLPCPWEELSEAERTFVRSVAPSGGLGVALKVAAGLVEDTVALGSVVEGATPSAQALRRPQRP
ncbi:hypothetical protein ACWDFH_23955 [Streptomyces kronopolitis]